MECGLSNSDAFSGSHLNVLKVWNVGGGYSCRVEK